MKIVISSLLLGSIAFANPLLISGVEALPQHPLQNNFLAIDNGGSMYEIDAFSDGIGAGIIGADENKINNAAFNDFVLKYGDKAKHENKSLVQYMKDSSLDYTESKSLEKMIANKGVIECNDKNSNTKDYLDTNENCVNEYIDCNDNNLNTNDSLKNGICINEQIGCDDKNPNTNDTLKNGLCSNIQIICDDKNPNTNDSLENGSCIYDLIKCDDNNVNTSDTINNGICIFTLKNCNDNNLDTIDTLENGKCFNRLINCNDNNPNTKDILTSGVCSHTLLCDDNNPDTIDTVENGSCVNTPNSIDIISINNSRMFKNSAYAASCNEYKNPAKPYIYSGATGSGSYIIDPDGSGGAAPIKVYCDMDSYGGGWTLINSFKPANRKIFDNREAYSMSNISSIKNLISAGFIVDKSYSISNNFDSNNFLQVVIPSKSYVYKKIPTFGNQIRIKIKQPYSSIWAKSFLDIGGKTVFTARDKDINNEYIGSYNNGDMIVIYQSSKNIATEIGDIYIK